MSDWSEVGLVRIKKESERVDTITLTYVREQCPLEPGDAIHIRAHSVLKELQGYYSLSRVGPQEIEVTFKRPFTRDVSGLRKLTNNRYFNIAHFFHHSSPGVRFWIRRLGGNRVGYQLSEKELDFSNSAQKIVLISGGLGITPNMAILRSIVERSIGEKKKVILVYSIRTEQDFIFKNELLQLKQAHPWFHLVIHKTRDGARSNRIDEAFFRMQLKEEEILQSRYFLCGPPRFSTDLASTLMKLGVQGPSIRLAGA